MRPRFAVFVCVASASTVAVAPGPAAAAPRHSHGLTISAAPDPIDAGQGVMIYGQLKGSPVAGQRIDLYHRVGWARHFSLIGHTTTDAFGFYSFTRETGVVTTNRSWFVRGPGGSHSRTVHERVQALISIAADRTTTSTGQPVTFTGKVSPTHRFQRVFLQEQVGSSDAWRTVAADRLDGGSEYSISYRWRTPGDRDLRVLLRADARSIRSDSDAVTVSVQQAQAPDFTINTSSPIIPEGATATISGVLYQPGSTTPEPGTSVSLWSREAGRGPLRKVEETMTAADGSYSFLEKPPVNEVYQVRATFSPDRQSAPLFQGVRDLIALEAIPTSTMIGGRVVFTGSVTPDKSRDLVYLQRLGGDGHWHAVEVQRVRPSSTFKFAWVFGKAGSEQFRARIFSDRGNVGTASAPVTIKIAGQAPISSLPAAG